MELLTADGVADKRWNRSQQIRVAVSEATAVHSLIEKLGLPYLVAGRRHELKLQSHHGYICGPSISEHLATVACWLVQKVTEVTLVNFPFMGLKIFYRLSVNSLFFVYATMGWYHVWYHGQWTCLVPWTKNMSGTMDNEHIWYHGQWTCLVPWKMNMSGTMDNEHVWYHGKWTCLVLWTMNMSDTMDNMFDIWGINPFCSTRLQRAHFYARN